MGTLEFHTDDILRDRNSFVLLTRLTATQIVLSKCICRKDKMQIIMIYISRNACISSMPMLHPYKAAGFPSINSSNCWEENQQKSKGSPPSKNICKGYP